MGKPLPNNALDKLEGSKRNSQEMDYIETGLLEQLLKISFLL